MKDGETGRVVDGRSVEEITDAVAGILADPALAAQLGQAGRRWIEEDWNWASHTARLSELLRVP